MARSSRLLRNEPMPRYRITIEYDGTPFVGWQIQAEGASVQGSLKDAILAFSGESVTVRGAGRTDSGVHALGQVAHFELSKEWPPDRIREALNYFLKPKPAVVLDCALAADDFDARFSATARHYLYRILSRRAPPALDKNRVWWIPARSIGKPCARPRACSKARMISRPSAPRSARPSLPSVRSITWG